jgi:hypothetical protein
MYVCGGENKGGGGVTSVMGKKVEGENKEKKRD